MASNDTFLSEEKEREKATPRLCASLLQSPLFTGEWTKEGSLKFKWNH